VCTVPEWSAVKKLASAQHSQVLPQRVRVITRGTDRRLSIGAFDRPAATGGPPGLALHLRLQKHLLACGSTLAHPGSAGEQAVTQPTATGVSHLLTKHDACSRGPCVATNQTRRAEANVNTKHQQTHNTPLKRY
jgi:hypothetical protein